jgi:hypothetical protein
MDRKKREKKQRERETIGTTRENETSGTTSVITTPQVLSAISAIASAFAATGSFLMAYYSYKANVDFQHRQLRAYAVVLFSALNYEDENQAPFVQVAFENSGQTPALNLTAECYSAIANDWQHLRFQEAGAKTLIPGTLAPKHQGSCIAAPMPTGPDLLNALKKGQQVLGARAYISYDDEYGEHHNAEFTGYLGGDVGLPSSGRMVLLPNSTEDTPFVQ